MTLGSLALAPTLPTLLAGTVSLAMGGWGALPILFCRGPHAVRSFVWAADGTWRLQLADGSWESASLLPATATLGPGAGWAILMVWLAEGSEPPWSRRRYALIDVWESGAPNFRSLKGRLKLEAAALRPVPL